MSKLFLCRLFDEVIDELKSWFCPPLANWQILPSLCISYVTSVSRDSEQDVVMALIDGYHVRPEEDVIKGRDEEEGLLNLVKTVHYIARFKEFLHIAVSEHFTADLIEICRSQHCFAFIGQRLLVFFLRY